jgi:hypothetical protein
MPNRLPKQFKDEVGKRYDRWTVINRADNKNGRAAFLCRCDCGTEAVVVGKSLRRGVSLSCGCFSADVARMRRLNHGHTALHETSPTFISWAAMMTRCMNSNQRSFKHYGGRGISVCKRWHSFENFLADMGERPPGKTLDRFPDGDGNYEPGNCRWATAKEQAANRRPRQCATL